MSPATLLALFAEAPTGPSNAKRTEPFLQKPEDWVVVGLLTGILLVAGAIFWFLERWRKRTLEPSAEDVAGELTDFRGMYERGEITDEEYARLREKVATRAAAPPKPPAGTGGRPAAPPGFVDLRDEGEEPPGPPGGAASPSPPGPPHPPAPP
jgi:hypothetical protein